MTKPSNEPVSNPRRRRRYVPAVGPRLERLLMLVFGLFALLAINAVYLVGVSILEWSTGETYQNWFYMNMFLVHLVLGVLIILPVILFGLLHMKNAYNRPNRRAVRVGYALFATALALLVSGVVLTRLEGLIVVKDETIRAVAYWVHVITPLIAGWLFVLHRLAGKKIRWEIGRRWAVVALLFGGVMVVWQSQDPRQWNVEGPESAQQYFFPSLARTATGDFIPEQVLDNTSYCQECHEDSHKTWEASVHHFASFNNQAYLASVKETREVVSVQSARFCAGCHDPVVFFSGKFDDEDFDMNHDPAGQAGITCTACHAITNINSPRGNADYTIEEPVHYPFTFSENESLQWVNRQLVKAKPEFHKKTFLKPLHKTPDFCGSCHKVHLPEELNEYKWLRGQNHLDTYHLSGVSGHGVASFYYPKQAEQNCNGCHMPKLASDQFGASDLDDTGVSKIHDHQFPSANTAIPHLEGMADWVNQRHLEFNDGVMRVDIFGLREGARIDGPLTGAIRPEVPTLEPGAEYLLETVVRTLKMGHLFTQGTSDSNQVWLDVLVTAPVADGSTRVVGRSGGMGEHNRVDPWSHFVNSYVLDREGRRIDRRNAQDIFVALYNHQIPPGAADSIHYRLEVPENVAGPLTVEVRLQYRKFDTTYVHYFMEDPSLANELPVMTLATDRVVFPVRGGPPVLEAQAPPTDMEWQRWNDYGIGLLRKGGKTKGELRQAEEAFARVEALGRYDGPLNLARVYLAQGTVQDRAIGALERAAAFTGTDAAPRWSIAWFTGLVNKQNGFLDEAIANFESIVEIDTEETRERGFDFSEDHNLLAELGQTLFERSKQERGDRRQAQREELLHRAEKVFQRTLELDPERADAHYNLNLIYKQLGDEERAKTHFDLHGKYKVDDNARDQAVAVARANDPAANHAAEAIVIYDLHRPEAFERDSATRRAAAFELEPDPSAYDGEVKDWPAALPDTHPLLDRVANLGSGVAAGGAP